ncbi:MAG: hypothetical protein O8C66_00840 [Candidatus Methanoperedens sp.]|nr:hypothetical protein [Candidatus Methanoperedens sp.]MCZ7369037.1 hypothetical protein [Candidatus Methanoperedens sp.]
MKDVVSGIRVDGDNVESMNNIAIIPSIVESFTNGKRIGGTNDGTACN